MRLEALVASFALTACGKVLPPDDAVDPCAAPNVCECTVATQTSDCPGAHRICDETSGAGRVCACAPAYADDGSGSCAFDAAPFDSGFQDPAKWTAVGDGVEVSAVAPGTINPGAALFSAGGACGFAAINQTFVMPPLELADPFKITVTHEGIDPSMFDIPDGTVVSVGVNGEFKDSIVERNAVVTQSFCLGPRAYGQGPVGSPVQFQVAVQPGAFSSSFLCNQTSQASFSVDQVKLEVATPGECPMPGTVVNGDFELVTDWTFNGTQSGAGAIVANVGENNSRAAQLSTANRCSEVTMTGTAAFPTTIQNPAIDVFFSGTSGARAVFQIAGKNLATLPGVTTPTHKRICIPKWAQGTTSPIGFFLQRASDNGCTTALVKSFTIDNLTITDDAACASTGDVIDPGFEHNTGPVIAYGLTDSFVNDIKGTTSVITAAGAHAGNRALRLVGANECAGVGDGGADLTINVPAAEGPAGPAIKFFANVGNGNLLTTTRIAVEPGPRNIEPGLRLDLPEVGVYQPAVFCLPPSTIGRRMTFRFSTGSTDGGGCVGHADEAAMIDDVQVGTDASCAAE